MKYVFLPILRYVLIATSPPNLRFLGEECEEHLPYTVLIPVFAVYRTRFFRVVNSSFTVY